MIKELEPPTALEPGRLEKFQLLVPREEPFRDHSEAFQDLVWHLIVSHPALKAVAT